MSIELSNNNFISAAIMQFAIGIDNVQSDLLIKLTLHMTCTYCRMTGKAFARKMMQTGFREKILEMVYDPQWLSYQIQS